MDCSPPGSSVRGILRARILQWVATSCSAHCRKESTTPCQPRRLVRRLGSPRRPSVAAGHAQSRAAHLGRSWSEQGFLLSKESRVGFWNQKYGRIWISGGFPGGTSGKEPAFQCRRRRRCGFHLWVGKIPWRRAWQSWRTPWTQEPDGLRHTGSQRVQHTEGTGHAHTHDFSALSGKFLSLYFK